MSGFLQALPATLSFEGGFVDHPADRGGATNRGVTQAVYDRWRRARGLPTRSVRKLEEEELEAIYHEIWTSARCDALPWPASALHFDAHVNHGPRNATRILQRAAGSKADGIFGSRTQAAADALPPLELAERMLWERLRLYQRILARDASQRTFAAGWLDRAIRLRDRIADG